MSRPLRKILKEYQHMRQNLLRARSRTEQPAETMEAVRERLRGQLLQIRREAYEQHGSPFGSSETAIEIWGQCGQYTTQN